MILATVLFVIREKNPVLIPNLPSSDCSLCNSLQVSDRASRVPGRISRSGAVPSGAAFRSLGDGSGLAVGEPGEPLHLDSHYGLVQNIGMVNTAFGMW